MFTLTFNDLNKHRWLALCLLASTPLMSQAALAQSASPSSSKTQNAGSDIRQYDIPAGPLAVVLNRFAEASSILLSADAALTRNKQSTGLRGSYSRQQALRLLTNPAQTGGVLFLKRIERSQAVAMYE